MASRNHAWDHAKGLILCVKAFMGLQVCQLNFYDTDNSTLIPRQTNSGHVGTTQINNARLLAVMPTLIQSEIRQWSNGVLSIKIISNTVAHNLKKKTVAFRKLRCQSYIGLCTHLSTCMRLHVEHMYCSGGQRC